MFDVHFGSRHWFFRAQLILDGQPAPHTLMQLVKAPLLANPSNSVIGFHDNSSAIRWVPSCVSCALLSFLHSEHSISNQVRGHDSHCSCTDEGVVVQPACLLYLHVQLGIASACAPDPESVLQLESPHPG